MATSTEIAIASQTLGSATTTITFTSIPSTYTDLKLVLVGKTASGGQVYVNFNSDTATNYSYTNIYGTGSAAASGRSTSQPSLYLCRSATWTAGVPSMIQSNFMSYSNTATYKTVISMGDTDANGSGQVDNTVGLWRSTAAINRMDIVCDSGNFSVGFTAVLYGIL